MKDFIVVIPARYASTRLPGKPLRLIDGVSMLERVHEIALRSGAKEVWIATDDERIEAAAKDFSANVCMTGSEHRSGTERIAEVAQKRRWNSSEIIVNLQGDEPLLPPAMINQCAALLETDHAAMATLVSGPLTAEEMADPNVVKVVVDENDYALYFSRAPIPFCRDGDADGEISLRHHGLYAYRPSILQQLTAATPCALEEHEKLEQLRALWLGIRIRVGHTNLQPGPGVDTEEDLDKVEAILANA